jgi:molybdenum cofactor cytidylyltransferase
MDSARSKFPGVIQAAGQSRRMGSLGQKLLLPLRGRPLIAHVAAAALASRLSEVVVVVGADVSALRAALPRDARLRVAVNARAAEGRSTTIRSGIEALGEDVPGALFLLGDQPLMTAELIDRVIARAEAEESREPGAPLVVPVVADGSAAGARKGNPVLFRRALFESLAKTEGDRGALDLILALWDEAARVSLDDARTQVRVETPDDYARLAAKLA